LRLKIVPRGTLSLHFIFDFRLDDICMVRTKQTARIEAQRLALIAAELEADRKARRAAEEEAEKKKAAVKRKKKKKPTRDKIDNMSQKSRGFPQIIHPIICF
jgi:hypothetical protein